LNKVKWKKNNSDVVLSTTPCFSPVMQHICSYVFFVWFG